MRKRNMLIPAVILMATLLSAGCTAGSTQGVTETAVQAESAVEENTDENAETKAIAVRGEVYTGSGLSQGPWGYESSHHVFTHVCSGLGYMMD